MNSMQYSKTIIEEYHIPEDNTLHNHRCENLKSYKTIVVLQLVSSEPTKYMLMLMSCHQNAGHNHNIKTANKSFESVARFKYLETTVINQNFIQEEIKRRLNSGNACYHSVQNVLSSRLLCKNIKIRIHKSSQGG
jgi:hypothetical protein